MAATVFPDQKLEQEDLIRVTSYFGEIGGLHNFWRAFRMRQNDNTWILFTEFFDIIGREILQTPSVLIVSQPTWGVDVGAAMVIRQALLDLRGRGAAILVISEELDELFEICDRIAVIAEGRLTEGKPTHLTNRDEIGLAMTGKETHSEAARGEVRHAVAL